MEKQEVKRVEVRDKEGNFLFRKEWLSGYTVIDGPMNKVALQVSSTPNKYDPDDGSSSRYIVNLKAILRSDIPELKTKFGQAQFIKADELNNMFLNATIWINEGQTPNIPMKGEMVLCNIGYVYSPQQGKDVLRVTGIHVSEPQEAEKLDLDVLFPEDEKGAFEKATIEDFEKAAKVS